MQTYIDTHNLNESESYICVSRTNFPLYLATTPEQQENSIGHNVQPFEIIFMIPSAFKLDLFSNKCSFFRIEI